MSDYNTGNAVPSNDPRDLDDNATVFDKLLMMPIASVPDRLGALRKTWWQMELDAAALVAPNVAALAALSPLADKAFYFSAAGPVAMSTYTLTSFVRNIGASADAAAFRTAISAAKSGANSDITSITGSAATLTAARSISITGDGTWSVSFNGSANVTGALTLAATGVSAGTYAEVTVNGKGLVTGASNGTMAALTLQNTWSVFTGYRCSYKKVGQNVLVEFGASGGTAADGTVLATLPAGFRPAFKVVVPVVSAPNTALSTTIAVPRVIIDTNGEIRCTNCTSAGGVFFAATFSIA